MPSVHRRPGSKQYLPTSILEQHASLRPPHAAMSGCAVFLESAMKFLLSPPRPAFKGTMTECGCSEALVVCLGVPLVWACDVAGDVCEGVAQTLIVGLCVPLVRACDLASDLCEGVALPFIGCMCAPLFRAADLYAGIGALAGAFPFRRH